MEISEEIEDPTQALWMLYQKSDRGTVVLYQTDRQTDRQTDLGEDMVIISSGSDSSLSLPVGELPPKKRC
jgi:hypothetical protein